MTDLPWGKLTACWVAMLLGMFAAILAFKAHEGELALLAGVVFVGAVVAFFRVS